VPMIDTPGRGMPGGARVSLHAPNDALRDRLGAPSTEVPLAVLLARGAIPSVPPRDFITFEYVMLEGVNDARSHAPSS